MYYYFKFGKIKSANNDCLTFMFPQTCIILNILSPYQNENYIPQQPSGGVLDNNKVIIY